MTVKEKMHTRGTPFPIFFAFPVNMKQTNLFYFFHQIFLSLPFIPFTFLFSVSYHRQNFFIKAPFSFRFRFEFKKLLENRPSVKKVKFNKREIFINYSKL